MNYKNRSKDEPQTTMLHSAIPSSAQLWEELAQMIINELLGPAHGEHEEPDECNMHDRYILGRLVPRTHTIGQRLRNRM